MFDVGILAILSAYFLCAYFLVFTVFKYLKPSYKENIFFLGKLVILVHKLTRLYKITVIIKKNGCSDQFDLKICSI